MVVKIDSSEALSDLTRLIRYGIGIIVLLALLIGGVGFSLNRLISKPIKEVTATTSDIARGFRNRRVDIDGSDEISQLGMSFNKMADRIQNSYEAL